MTRLVWKMCAIGMSLGLVGCSSRVTLSEWQAGLDKFAATQGNGDTSFLRDNQTGAGAVGFTALGAKSPDESTDVVGVLLRRRTIQNADWMVFLVASVNRRKVEDIRVAMLRDDQANRRWLIGREDPRSLETYRRYKDEIWRRLHPGRTDPPLSALDFPSPSDVYRLEASGNTVSITETKSGARWTLVMEEKKSTSPKVQKSK